MMKQRLRHKTLLLLLLLLLLPALSMWMLGPVRKGKGHAAGAPQTLLDGYPSTH